MNKELERLIELALMDDVISNKEKVILIEKAKGYGVQLDELEMIIDAKILEKSQNIDVPNSKVRKKKVTKINEPLITGPSFLKLIYQSIKFVLRGIYNFIKGFVKIFENIFDDGCLGCFSVIIIMISSVIFSVLFLLKL